METKFPPLIRRSRVISTAERISLIVVAPGHFPVASGVVRPGYWLPIIWKSCLQTFSTFIFESFPGGFSYGELLELDWNLMLVIRVGVRLFHKWIADVYTLMENLKMQEYMKRISYAEYENICNEDIFKIIIFSEWSKSKIIFLIVSIRILFIAYTIGNGDFKWIITRKKCIPEKAEALSENASGFETSYHR